MSTASAVLGVFVLVDSVVDNAVAIVVDLVAGLDPVIGGLAQGLTAIFDQAVSVDVSLLAGNQNAGAVSACTSSMRNTASVAAYAVLAVELEVEAFV